MLHKVVNELTDTPSTFSFLPIRDIFRISNSTKTIPSHTVKSVTNKGVNA